MGVRKWFIIFLIALLFGYLVSAWELRAEASFEEQSGLTFSPDKQAYTTDAGNTNWEWYARGTEVLTGVESSLRTPDIGEHYYKKEVDGVVNVGRWKVTHAPGMCLHQRYAVDVFHGVTFNKKCCMKKYFSGWFPYCADCGECLVKCYHYMSDETAKGLAQIDLSRAYYYKCPHCDNLEQATEQPAHMCKDVSYNRYFVCYDANRGNGYMAKSVHMYNNATLYEGKEVTPQTVLNINTFTRRGYVFAGWNTMADGSGMQFEEGAEIYNLSAEEAGEVILYAQWEKCTSILQIDPAGGIYNGSREPVNIEGSYGEVFELTSKELTTPPGFTVHFETQGGTEVADIVGETVLESWRLSTPFYGELEDECYVFSDREGIIDRITAVYAEVPIVLPEASKEGFSFGGWYLDEECTKPVGGAGSEILPGKDITLYAGWVDLQLTAKDNYTANGGKGAVDLSWSQQDSNNKVYVVYQKAENSDWVQVSSATQKEVNYETSTTVDYTGQSTTYTVPFSGFYTLTLYGAQGGNYLTGEGGKGGKVQASIYLEKGERLTCTIGGQNGFHGGGASTEYGNGGGYSEVCSDKKGTLLIAGGGGGASLTENGKDGGGVTSLATGREGEAGVSGGGGGYQGGSAGVAQIHTHTSDCNHVHEGNASVYGGCYTVPTICMSVNFEKKLVENTFYYGNIHWNNGRYESCYCVQCRSYECPGHYYKRYDYICETCGKNYGESLPESCTAIGRYDLGCERDESYICGMDDGEIIRSSPAYGGSNYVNSEYCFHYTQEAGVRSGNGGLHIASERIGVLDVQQLYGVNATDLQAPETIDITGVEKTAVSENEIRISFAKPQDLGTRYYHQVKSYSRATNQWICTSNQTVNTLVSGVAGYYYVLDTKEDTQVGTEDTFLDQRGDTPFLTMDVTEETRYLHIAPVDKAGNIGATVSIVISAQEMIYWPIRTEKIEVSPGTNLIAAAVADTYYVRADGSTPIEVAFEGGLCGTAGTNYQIDETSFCMLNETTKAEGKFTAVTPKKQPVTAGTFTYPMQALQKKVSGEIGLQDDGYTVTKRYNQCKSIRITQKFVVPSACDGQRIRLTPQAAAIYEKEITYSDASEDVKHSIWFIADGTGPYLQGLEALEGLEYVDYSQGEEVKVCLQAKDTGSGLGRFYVEIHNQENATMICHEDASLSGKIEFTISEEDLVYNGEFAIIIYAVDAVGNETVVSTKLLGVGLSAYVERILEPHDAAFKRGESGILHIQTVGYVERVEVSFPEEFAAAGADYNQVFVYESPSYMQNEAVEFMIPLTIPDGAKAIQVKAFKAGTELEKTPQLLTVEIKGSVLDELRTRLR